MRSKIKFVLDFVAYGLKGGILYWCWMLFLAFFILLWMYGNYQQFTLGMRVTGLTDQVSWGMYLANFIFLVGVAAAAVTVVFPAYVYKHEELHKVVVLGEMLAVSAVVMCLLFVISHMGRPDRLWHLLPGIGIMNFPHSMLAWDTIVLSGYLVLNAVGGFYYLYKKYMDRPLNKAFYLPLVYIAIVWALSIHTVTAFLINTMPARPMWFHGMMPIKFIITAFAAGPALIIITFLTVRRFTKLEIGDRAIDTLSTIMTFCLGITLFLSMSEIVTELYPSTEHSFGLQYLMFSFNGLKKLVPWFWFAQIAILISFFLLLIPVVRKNYLLLPFICALAFFGIWSEKGMGLLLPGFIPSPVGEYSEYFPTIIEIFNTCGNWCGGFFLFTLLIKGSVGILVGDLRYNEKPQNDAVVEQGTTAPA